MRHLKAPQTREKKESLRSRKIFGRKNDLAAYFDANIVSTPTGSGSLLVAPLRLPANEDHKLAICVLLTSKGH